MALEPEVRILLDQLEALGFPGFAAMTVEQARLVFAEVERPPGEPVARIEDTTVPGPAGDIPVRAYRPNGSDLPLVVFFHGGGWTIGDIEGHDPICRAIANRAGAVVLSVGYRLGPEHRFPAAVEDAWAAVRWAAEHAAELGGDASRLVVAGDSAGGNLAAVVALMARDTGGPAIAQQVLIYPATDLRPHNWPSYAENGQGYFLTVADMQWFEGHYVRSPEDVDDWRMSPAAAASHASLPPAFVLTAEHDPLRDQGEAYADLLRAAGVPVTLTRYQGQIHGFLSFEVLEGGRRAVADIAAEMRSTLGLPAPA